MKHSVTSLQANDPGRDVRPVAMRLMAVMRRHLPLILFAVFFLAFCAFSPGFRTVANVRNILVQSSSLTIVAVGMTFVLLTGGIDLSVGAVMFLGAAIGGRLSLGGWIPGLQPVSVVLVLALIVTMGLLFGTINACLVAGCRLLPFVVTLATLFVGRGLALQVTETRPLNLPPEFLTIGQAAVWGVPLSVLLMAAVAACGHLVLSRTPYGRQLYALGNNPEAARMAGLPTIWLMASVYIVCGGLAAVAGIVSVAQLGAVSPTFGYQREFAAIAAAVLGGTSLFGGRGSILPGTVLGAVLIQTVETGLNVINADPYSYPVVIGLIIFITVLLDRLRPG